MESKSKKKMKSKSEKKIEKQKNTSKRESEPIRREKHGHKLNYSSSGNYTAKCPTRMRLPSS